MHLRPSVVPPARGAGKGRGIPSLVRVDEAPPLDGTPRMGADPFETLMGMGTHLAGWLWRAHEGAQILS